MKRVAVVALVLCLAAGSLVTACAPGSGAPGLALGSAPWQDGEQATYNVVDKNGSQWGTMTFGFAREGEAWALSFADQTAGQQHSGKVRIDAASLLPLSEEETIKAPGTEATVNSTYSAGRVTIKAVVNGQSKDASLTAPANAIENDQLLMTVRALQFAEGYEGKYVLVNAKNALKLNASLRVTGKEQVTVPAGAFDTWRVEFTFGQQKQMAWYQVEAPYALVQYDNGTTKMVLTKGLSE